MNILDKNEEVIHMCLYRCGNKIKYVDYRGMKSARVKRLKVRKQVNSYVQQLLEKWNVGMFFMELGIRITLG